MSNFYILTSDEHQKNYLHCAFLSLILIADPESYASLSFNFGVALFLE